MNLPLPQIEGKYEILHKIKEGGMGAIYKVRHRLLEELRVVKTIRPQFAGDPEVRERFLREAKTAIGLRHLNVAQLYDFSVDAEGTAYIVMEFIDGVTFQELLAKGGPPPVPLTMELSRQALDALAYLHQRGFVHRDVAPDNLMLTRTFDGLPQVKLIDLGIAKRLESEGVDLTTTGTFLGKVRYAAPEQFSDGSDGGIGPWSDVYSFGVMLYELLTGQPPIQGQNVSEVMAGHLFRSPLAFEETDPEGRVPEDLRAIVLHALAKAPAERTGSAEELAARLAPHLPEPASLYEELDQTLRATTEVLVDGDEVSEPGSTQDRLAEQFGLEATPAPGPSKRPAGPRRVETRAEEIAALLASAQLLARLEEFRRAKGELERLLELDPESREARELLDSVEAALRERQAKRRRAAPEPLPRPSDEETRPVGIRRRLSSLPRWAWAVAAGFLLVAVVTLAWYWASPPGDEAAPATAPPMAVAELGYLELDALPWAEVVEIRDAAGDPVPLDSPTYTPVRLDLPPGTYTVSLTHGTVSEPTVITVEVHTGEVTKETVHLGGRDAEE